MSHSPRSLLFLADVGGPASWHVGDEAMLEANLALFRQLLPDAALVVASGAPAATAARLGVQAVARLDFATVSPTRGAERAQIEAMQAAALQGAAAPPAMHAMLTAEALVISGGGNLCSAWPGHILERLAMVRLARALGRPVIILGQTIGPWLNAEDQPLVAELLGAAQWVGVREAASYALARQLGVAPALLHLQADDAAALVPAAAQAPPARPMLLLTLHAFTPLEDANPWLDALAAELGRLAQEIPADLVFLPHAAPAQPGQPADLDMAAALARRLPLRVLPLPQVAAAVAAAAGASLIISSRYHPLVFGLAAGVPCLGLPVDEYTRTKLHGALATYGQQDALFPLEPPDCSGLAAQALRLWHRRHSVRASLAAARAAAQLREATRIARLAACLAGALPAPAQGEDWLATQLSLALAASNGEVARLHALRVEPGVVAHLRQSQQAAETYALDLRQHLDLCQAELARSLDHSQLLFAEITRLRAAG